MASENNWDENITYYDYNDFDDYDRFAGYAENYVDESDGSDMSPVVENVVFLYPEDFPDREELKNDLNIFLNVVRRRGQYKDLKTLQDVTMKMVELRHNSESTHLQMFKLYCLMLTLPVSTASNERVFSALKILKTRLRNKIQDDNLNNQMLLNVNKDLTKSINIDAVIDDFSAADDSDVTRRIRLRM